MTCDGLLSQPQFENVAVELEAVTAVPLDSTSSRYVLLVGFTINRPFTFTMLI